MTVRTQMTLDPPIVTLRNRIADAAAIMRDRRVAAVVVVDDEHGRRVQGLLTERQIVIDHVAADHPRECRVHEHLARLSLDTIAPDADVEKAYEVMQRAALTQLPVVDTMDDSWVLWRYPPETVRAHQRHAQAPR